MSGAVGDNAKHINGVFKPSGEIQNGREMYVRVDNPDKWLRFMANGKWAVSSASDKDANNLTSWCSSQDLDANDPTQVRSWSVYNGKEFITQPNVAAAHRFGKV